MKSRIALLSLPAVAVLALAGCSTAGASADGGAGSDGVTVVASTNVYGDLVHEIAGDKVTVISLISSAAQDPHEYEATAKDRLEVSKAQLVVRNGGGYDAFIDGMVPDGAKVITAADEADDAPGDDHDHEDADEHDHDESGAHEGHDHIEGFNEHVWYSPEVMRHVAEEVADELGELLPDQASEFTAKAAAFGAEVTKIEDRAAELKTAAAGAKIFVTEPLPLRLTDLVGLVNVTPAEFSEAVEEGQDVPPATMLAAQGLLSSGQVRAVIVNSQTGGAETTAVAAEAKKEGIPVLEFSELQPDGSTYAEWMNENLDKIAAVIGA
ncbi:metal ABC transporter solute-binding protein, Zn/Mn family [Microbacterium gorillae]|uniref:metal ABC transporter solute-binding protein, Zn/Mn family n=1 Tax=Microbacterium gorillae TaxID=1231063 RepID=UPI0005911AA5|nr:zinc ABC transporter substrate-binding protein [Microbacterium gorillae]